MSNSAEPRLTPLPAERWGDETLSALRQGEGSLISDQLKEALRDADLAGLAEILPGPVATLLRHPSLAGGFLAMNGVHLSESALPQRWRELVVLRVAWRTGCDFEWLQHVRMAPRFGIDAEEIMAVAEGIPRWRPPEGELLAAADQLIDSFTIDDTTWQALADHLDERQLIEVPFLVGTYVSFAMACNSFGVRLDPGLMSVDPVVRRRGSHTA